MNRAWQVSDLPAWIRPNVTLDMASGCFMVGPGNGIWINSGGYAMAGGTGIHRLVYAEVIGPIPDDKPVIDHVRKLGCVHRNCAMPGHLEPCTVRENTFRGASFIVANFYRTACSTCSTPYDLFNLYVYPDGRRDCRVCRAAARERYKKRQQDKTLVTLAEADSMSLAA